MALVIDVYDTDKWRRKQRLILIKQRVLLCESEKMSIKDVILKINI